MTLIKITLNNESIKLFNSNVSGYEIASDISKSLAKKALAVLVNGNLWDIHRKIEQDSTVTILTKEDPHSLDIIRHSTAHLMAQAVKELFPETQITIGPVIKDGFYYDFYRDNSFSTSDIVSIEEKMKELIGKSLAITREVWNREKAIEFFKDNGEYYKAEIIKDIPEGEDITLYRQGDFIDLCRGPHLPDTGKIGNGFKLTKISGSYWKGDAKNVSLQRIYGTVWASEKDLKTHLVQIAEAEKRDHRILGPKLKFFHLQDDAPGNVFWHQNGWKVFRLLQDYIRDRTEKNGYQEVNTPVLVNKEFWEKSGHWEKFREHMFTTEDSDNNRTMAMKPMNCPCHVQIFKKGIKSYRDLPLRMAEFGYCNRNEPSGALHGLMRVRAFTQDDAHIFCTEEQIIDETKQFCDLLKLVYKDFGFEDILVKFSDRPTVRAGDDKIWDKAEQSLISATKAAGLEYSVNKGEGAFYGPKLEFVLKDAIGRHWQCGTLQVDFVLPERLDAKYINSEGKKVRPVMLHRAILGSFERFLAILIENYSGRLPLWLSPVQVGIVPISEDNHVYAKKIYDKLNKLNIRCEIDLRNEKMNYKIREFSNMKIPYIFVIGKKEESESTVNVRMLGEKQQEVFPLLNILEKIQQESISPAKI